MFKVVYGGLLTAFWILLGLAMALGQSNPNFIPGQVPTAAQWNSYFSSKQDVLGFRPLNKTGDIMSGLLRFTMPTPVLTSCGTSPSITGNNQVGEVTMGTGSPTGCTITFDSGNPWIAAPKCTVTWQSNLASMQYTISQSTIVLVQTGTSSNKVDYICMGIQ